MSDAQLDTSPLDKFPESFGLISNGQGGVCRIASLVKKNSKIVHEFVKKMIS